MIATNNGVSCNDDHVTDGPCVCVCLCGVAAHGFVSIHQSSTRRINRQYRRPSALYSSASRGRGVAGAVAEFGRRRVESCGLAGLV